MSLPPEREIATLTDLLRATVRKAIQSLVEEGLIVQRRGSGSFDASDALRIERSLSLLTSFSEDMKRRGMTSTSVWLERGIFMPSPDEGMALALAPDQSVSRIARLRRVDDKPMAIERASLSLRYYLPSNHAIHSFPLKSKLAIPIMEYYLSKLC